MNFKSVISQTSSLICFLLFAVLISNNSYAGSIDSLLNEREKLVEQYNMLISTARTSAATDRQIFDYQNRIIAIDNFLIDDQFVRDLKENKTYKSKYSKLEDKHDDLWILFYVVGGVAIVMLVLFIVFAIMYSGAKKRVMPYLLQFDELNMLLDSYINDIERLNNENEQNKFRARDAATELTKLQTQVDDFDRRGAANHIEMVRIKSENTKLQEKIAQLESTDSNTADLDLLNERNKKIEEQNNIITEKGQEINLLIERIENIDNKLKLAEEEHNKKDEVELALKNEMEELNKELALLKSSIEEASDIKSNESGNEGVQDLEKEIENLKEDNRCLNEMLKAAEQLQKDLAQDLAETKENTSKTDDSEKDNLKETLNEQLEDIMSYQKQLLEVSEEKSSLQWKINLLEEKLHKESSGFDYEEIEQSEEFNEFKKQISELQAELMEAKKLLEEELENREQLISEFKELEDYYKNKDEESGLKDESETINEIDSLREENEALKQKIQSFDEIIHNEEQARLELENELKELLDKFSSSDDTQTR